MKPTLIFFGSFQHYSAKVLQALIKSGTAHILAVVTTPPALQGKQKLMTKNPTHELADTHHLPVLTPSRLGQLEIRSIRNLPRPDFFVVAGYGKLLPKAWLSQPTIACLNLHFSLLPKYRGANPAEWAILSGEIETGVTLIKMDAGVDTGPIITQEKLPISPANTRETLYERLYDLASNMIVNFFGQLRIDKLKIGYSPQGKPEGPYARRLTRPDGFIPWTVIQKAMSGESIEHYELPHLFQEASTHPSKSSLSIINSPLSILERATRALYGYPGLWTSVKTSKGEKRLKILSCQIIHYQLSIIHCQLEGLQPSTFSQIKNQILA